MYFKILLQKSSVKTCSCFPIKYFYMIDSNCQNLIRLSHIPGRENPYIIVTIRTHKKSIFLNSGKSLKKFCIKVESWKIFWELKDFLWVKRCFVSWKILLGVKTFFLGVERFFWESTHPSTHTHLLEISLWFWFGSWYFKLNLARRPP